jgi:hypothetical protein
MIGSDRARTVRARVGLRAGRAAGHARGVLFVTAALLLAGTIAAAAAHATTTIGSPNDPLGTVGDREQLDIRRDGASTGLWSPENMLLQSRSVLNAPQSASTEKIRWENRFENTQHELKRSTMGANNNCGRAVAMGDFNADGFADVAFGCPLINVSGQADVGRVYVWYRNASNGGFTNETIVDKPGSITTSDAGAQCGVSIAAGDINDDGVDDLAVGCPFDNNGGTSTGSSFTYLGVAGTGAPGNVSATPFTSGQRVTHPTASGSAECGSSVALGDVELDGDLDLAMGCRSYSSAGFTNNGIATLFRWNGTIFDENAAGALPPRSVGAGSSQSGTDWRQDSAECGGIGNVAFGDVDGDRDQELILGCRYRDLAGDADRGAAFIRYWDSATGNFGNSAFLKRADGPGKPDDRCGGVSTGDFDRDGKADVMMGCYLGDIGGVVDAGLTVSFTGSFITSSYNSAPNTAIVGTDMENNSTSTSTANCAYDGNALGDMNGDGYDDMIMGCYSASPSGGTDAGKAVIYLWDPDIGAFQQGFYERGLDGGTAGDKCGIDVAAGDINGDGRDDFAMGCYQADRSGTVDAGVVDGNTLHKSHQLWNATPTAGDFCGRSVAVADFDGDGRSDVVEGCEQETSGGFTNAGSFFFRLRSHNLRNVSFDGAVEKKNSVRATSDFCGTTVAAGDLNGDGFDDIVLGCYGMGVGGQAVAWYWNPTNTTDTPYGSFVQGATLVPPVTAAGDDCTVARGIAVGDMNGDGLGDVLMGCTLNDAIAVDAGNVFAFRSLTRGVAAAPTFSAGVAVPMPSALAGDACGRSVSLGDVDNDEKLDAIIGCRLADNGATVNVGAGMVALSTATTGGALSFGNAVKFMAAAPVASDRCGHSTASGDVNGDGRADLILGCDQGDPGGQANAGYVVVRFSTTVLGGPPTFAAAGTPLSRNGPVAGDTCGQAVSVNDNNADGYADVAAGCDTLDTGAATDNGGAIIWTYHPSVGFGTGQLLDKATPVDNDTCGQHIATGDVNGDGRGDVVIGCNRSDNGGAANAGSAIVVINQTRAIFSRTQNVTSQRINKTTFDSGGQPGVVRSATIDLSSVELNSQTISIELSHDGGASWQPATYDPTLPSTPEQPSYDITWPGATNAQDIRFRITFNNTHPVDPDLLTPPWTLRRDWDPWKVNRTAVVGDFELSYTGSYPPDTPTTSSPANGAVVTTGSPSLSATYVDSALEATKDNGSVEVRVCSDAACSTVLDSGMGTVVASGATSQWFPSPALAPGTYWWDVRNADVNGPVSAWRGTRSFRVDAAPGATTLSTPSAGATTSDTTPDLTANYTDPDGDAGVLDFQVCSVTFAPAQTCAAAGGTLEASGSSASIASGSPGTWTTTPALSHGTHYWRARGTDSPGMSGAWTAARAFHVTTAPTATLVTPANGATTSDTTPNLTARFNDPDAVDTGQLFFEICTANPTPAQTCAGAGGSIVGSGITGTGIAENATGTSTMAPAAANGSYWWRARASDQFGAMGAWSSTWVIVIGSPTLNISVDSPTVALGTVNVGADVTGVTTITVSTSNYNGYTLDATDASDTWGLNQAGVDTVPDWTGTNAAPTTWNAGVSGYFGLTVLAASNGGKDTARWGTGAVQNAYATLKYVGLKTTSTTLFTRTGFNAAAETVTTSYRINPSTAELSGGYSSTISYTLTANP